MLFESYQLGHIHLKNRIVMPPMTRSRAGKGDIPTELMSEYYAQRASAGLIISEGTPISTQGRGYAWTPGIYTPEQIKGWKKSHRCRTQEGWKNIRPVMARRQSITHFIAERRAKSRGTFCHIG